MTTLIRVVDLETTGFTPPEAGVCEIAWHDVESHKVNLALEPTDWRITGSAGTLTNPGHPIPAVTSAIHHIIDDDVAGAMPFRDILQVTGSASREVIDANYRRLAKDRHPDSGGSADAMADLNNARDTALREIGQ